MENGVIDLAVSGVYEDLPEGFYQKLLLTDPYRSCINKQHPKAIITPDDFLELSHILVTPKGDLRGLVDTGLAKAAKRRKISMAFSHFLSAGYTAAHTDLVLTAPGRIIDILQAILPLRDFVTQ